MMKYVNIQQLGDSLVDHFIKLNEHATLWHDETLQPYETINAQEVFYVEKFDVNQEKLFVITKNLKRGYFYIHYVSGWWEKNMTIVA